MKSLLAVLSVVLLMQAGAAFGQSFQFKYPAPRLKEKATFNRAPVTPGELEISTNSQPFPAMQVGGTSSETRQAIIRNKGSSSVRLSTLLLTNNRDFSFSHNCPNILASRQQCTASVSFKPRSAGALTTQLRAISPTGSVSASFTGEASGVPRMSLSTSSLTFSGAIAGASFAQGSITVTNEGQVPVSISSLQLSSAAGPYSATSECPVILDVGANCSILVRFTPTTTQQTSATLTVVPNYEADHLPLTVDLSGRGLLRAVSVTDSLAFGTVVSGTISNQVVTLNNTGEVPLSLGAPSSSGAPFSISSSNCTNSLAVAASCSYVVRFSAGLSGLYSGASAIATSAGQVLTMLSGESRVQSAAISATSLSFLDQIVNSSSALQEVLLVNTGELSISVWNITTNGDFQATHNCPASLPGGNSCVVAVRFSPSAGGYRLGELNISTGLGTYSATLSGTGLTLEAGVSSTEISFGPANVGASSSNQILTLFNRGTAPLSVGAISASVPFSVVSNDCPVTLQAGASCLITVGFSPVSAGELSGSLTILTGAGPQSVTLRGFGRVYSLAANASTLSFGNLLTTDPAQQQILTYQNTGNSTINLVQLSASFPFTIGTTCTSQLAAGASCSVTVQLNMRDSGPISGTLILSAVEVPSVSTTLSASITGWTTPASVTTSSLRGIAYSTALNRYVAVGAAGTILTSSDAFTWSAQNSGTTNQLNEVTFDLTTGLFIAVGNAGTILTSVDGLSWAARISNTTNALNTVSRGPGVLVAAGAAGVLRTSTNGTTWSTQPSFANAPSISRVAHDGTNFVAVGSGGAAYSSSNGISWTSRSSGASVALNDSSTGGPLGFTSVTAGRGIFSANLIYRSPTGTAWSTTSMSGSNTDFFSIAHGPNGYISVGAAGAGQLSATGSSWATHSLRNTTSTFRYIRYINGRYIAVGDNGIIRVSRKPV